MDIKAFFLIAQLKIMTIIFHKILAIGVVIFGLVVRKTEENEIVCYHRN